VTHIKRQKLLSSTQVRGYNKNYVLYPWTRVDALPDYLEMWLVQYPSVGPQRPPSCYNLLAFKINMAESFVSIFDASNPSPLSCHHVDMKKRIDINVYGWMQWCLTYMYVQPNFVQFSSRIHPLSGVGLGNSPPYPTLKTGGKIAKSADRVRFR